MAKRVPRLLEVQPLDRVLEIGFGPGVAIEILARPGVARSVTGIDSSEEMCKQAKVRNATHVETGRVVLVRSAVDSLPFRDSAFDKALAIRSIQIWPDAIAGLCEIRRVLRPGGRLILGLANNSGQTHEGLAELLRASRFHNVRIIRARKAYFALATNFE